ncbi:MAG TPA: hypothetical protein VLX08_03895 [Steroidobacteraceae bacterium]|nr:hypothetical protein [Steroidobacteraceae bacterium]
MTGREGPDGRTLVKSLGELPQSIEPPRDLWPTIEARLGGIEAPAPAATAAQSIGRRRSARLRWLAAAAMIASVAVGVWIGRSLLPLPGAVPGARSPASAANDTSAVTGAPTALDAAYVADPRYERQRAELLRSLQTRLAALPPASRAKVMASLETIQRAKEDLERALGRDPGNALLQELLVNTYQDEMRVLTDVREASDPGEGI